MFTAAIITMIGINGAVSGDGGRLDASARKHSVFLRRNIAAVRGLAPLFWGSSFPFFRPLLCEIVSAKKKRKKTRRKTESQLGVSGPVRFHQQKKTTMHEQWDDGETPKDPLCIKHCSYLSWPRDNWKKEKELWSPFLNGTSLHRSLLLLWNEGERRR